MDARENREKLEKLATLSGPQVQVMYYRCLDKTVSQITDILELANEGTVWSRFTEIFKKLGVSGQEDLVLQYSPLFLKYIKSDEDWKNWGHIRAAILEEARAVSPEPPRPAPIEPDKPRQPSSRSRVPWPVAAIPLLILGLLCIAGLVFGGPFLTNLLNRPPTSTTVSETLGPVIEDTSSPQSPPSATVQMTNTANPLPTDTVTPTFTFTPTATLTPIPTETKSPMGLSVGDELGDERVTLRLTKVGYNEKYDRLGARVAPISYYFDFTNHSGETIVLQFDTFDFKITDNTGAEANCWFYHISGAGEEVNESLTNGSTREIIARCGLGTLNPAVTTFTLTVFPFSSLPESTWVVDIPH